MIRGKIYTTTPGLRTMVKGIWGVGEANSDNGTNALRDVASGKKAAVSCHGEIAALGILRFDLLSFIVELATEELAQIGSNLTKRTVCQAWTIWNVR
jgi:hypothetical protein